MICCTKLDTPFMLRPLRRMPMTNAPITVPEMVPTPPVVREAPPITALAMASIS